MNQLESAAATWRRASQDEERGAITPAQVQFELRGPLRFEAPDLVLAGALVNSGDAVEVVLFPVDDRTPFFVHMMTSEALEPRPHQGPERPPEPPAGRVLSLPAQTEVLFRESVNLDDYIASSYVGAQLAWSFQFWADPKPEGVLTLDDEMARLIDATLAVRP